MLENTSHDENHRAVVAENDDEGFKLLVYDADGECTDEYIHESMDSAIAHAEDDFGFSPSGWANSE